MTASSQQQGSQPDAPERHPPEQQHGNQPVPSETLHPKAATPATPKTPPPDPPSEEAFNKTPLVPDPKQADPKDKPREENFSERFVKK